MSTLQLKTMACQLTWACGASSTGLFNCSVDVKALRPCKVRAQTSTPQLNSCLAQAPEQSQLALASLGV